MSLAVLLAACGTGVIPVPGPPGREPPSVPLEAVVLAATHVAPERHPFEAALRAHQLEDMLWRKSRWRVLPAHTGEEDEAGTLALTLTYPLPAPGQGPLVHGALSLHGPAGELAARAAAQVPLQGGQDAVSLLMNTLVVQLLEDAEGWVAHTERRPLRARTSPATLWLAQDQEHATFASRYSSASESDRASLLRDTFGTLWPDLSPTRAEQLLRYPGGVCLEEDLEPTLQRGECILAAGGVALRSVHDLTALAAPPERDHPWLVLGLDGRTRVQASPWATPSAAAP